MNAGWPRCPATSAVTADPVATSTCPACTLEFDGAERAKSEMASTASSGTGSDRKALVARRPRMSLSAPSGGAFVTAVIPLLQVYDLVYLKESSG